MSCGGETAWFHGIPRAGLRWAPKNQGERETSATKSIFWAIYLGHHNSHIWRGLFEGPFGSTGIWTKKMDEAFGDFLVRFLVRFFCNTWGEAAWCSSWCFFLRSADVCFYFSKMKVFLLEVKLGMHKDKMDENYNHTLYICILYSIYIYITFSIFLSWVGHDAIICQPLEDNFIYRSHDPDVWKLGPQKISSLKMHEDVRIDRRNPSVFAFWDGAFKVISLAFNSSCDPKERLC